MPTIPAASPSSPSTKFTALMVSSTTNTVRAQDARVEKMSRRHRQRDELHALPRHEPGGDGLAGELRDGVQLPHVVGDPEQADAPAPSSTPHGPPDAVEELLEWNDISLAVTIATANPRNIATPPIRGMGTACTSRSRTGVMAPMRRAIRRISGVVR